MLGEHEEADDDGSALGGLTHLGKSIADMDDFSDVSSCKRLWPPGHVLLLLCH